MHETSRPHVYRNIIRAITHLRIIDYYCRLCHLSMQSYKYKFATCGNEHEFSFSHTKNQAAFWYVQSCRCVCVCKPSPLPPPHNNGHLWCVWVFIFLLCLLLVCFHLILCDNRHGPIVTLIRSRSIELHTTMDIRQQTSKRIKCTKHACSLSRTHCSCQNLCVHASTSPFSATSKNLESII